MARARSVFACTECGAQQPRWLGRCPECGSWSTLVEEAIPSEARAALRGEATGAAQPAAARPLREIEPDAAPRSATGVGELDRVLGGGLVRGSVILLGGEPGIGKSTLALQMAAAVLGSESKASPPGAVLYVSGEESPEQVRLRAERLGGDAGSLLLLPETRVEVLAETWRKLAPRLVLVDSIQTLRSDRIESAAGSVAQVRECASHLAALAKSEGACLLLIGHVTKDGAIAGPRVLEHLVDVVLTFEGDRAHPFRLLRASKNRFGSTAELGVFHMGERGLEAVANPSELFLAERRAGAPGSCIVPLVEGSRPFLVELQALVAPAGYGTARRTCLGIDDGRVALLLAVLERRGGLDLCARDVYTNVTGGVRVVEPAADLALALALASSHLDLAIPPDVAACGEIGLGGEVRRVGRLDLRLREAARLGFRRLVVPDTGERPALPPGVELAPVRDVAAALGLLREVGVRASAGAPPSPVNFR